MADYANSRTDADADNVAFDCTHSPSSVDENDECVVDWLDANDDDAADRMVPVDAERMAAVDLSYCYCSNSWRSVFDCSVSDRWPDYDSHSATNACYLPMNIEFDSD